MPVCYLQSFFCYREAHRNPITKQNDKACKNDSPFPATFFWKRENEDRFSGLPPGTGRWHCSLKGLGAEVTLLCRRHPLLADSTIAAAAAEPRGCPTPEGALCCPTSGTKQELFNTLHMSTAMVRVKNTKRNPELKVAT